MIPNPTIPTTQEHLSDLFELVACICQKNDTDNLVALGRELLVDWERVKGKAGLPGIRQRQHRRRESLPAEHGTHLNAIIQKKRDMIHKRKDIREEWSPGQNKNARLQQKKNQIQHEIWRTTFESTDMHCNWMWKVPHTKQCLTEIVNKTHSWCQVDTLGHLFPTAFEPILACKLCMSSKAKWAILLVCDKYEVCLSSMTLRQCFGP